MSLDVNISEPEEFNCVELHSCIEDVAKILEVQDLEYHVDFFSGNGENYVANLFQVIITDTSNKDNTNRVVVKTLVNTERKDVFHEFHKREVSVYTEIIPKFKQLQEHLNEKDRVCFPKCLYTNADKNKEVIILKDLRDIGFGIDDVISKYKELTFSQIKLILTELAKFHALSFVYEYREKENFETMKGKYKDFLFEESFICKSKLRNYFFESFDMSLELATDIGVRGKLGRIRDKLIEILRMYSHPSKNSVFCHGDLWINNILFKQGESEDELCFLDFQVTRYCSPVIDILQFIYLTSTSKFRSDHFDELQNAYYDSLSSYLKLFDIDSHVVYSREDFEAAIEYNLPYGLIVALIELRITTASNEELEHLEDDKLSTISANSKYDFRVRDVIEEAVNNGALDKLVKIVNDGIDL